MAIGLQVRELALKHKRIEFSVLRAACGGGCCVLVGGSRALERTGLDLAALDLAVLVRSCVLSASWHLSGF